MNHDDVTPKERPSVIRAMRAPRRLRALASCRSGITVRDMVWWLIALAFLHPAYVVAHAFAEMVQVMR